MLRTLGLPAGNLIRRPTIRNALREFFAGDSVNILDGKWPFFVHAQRGERVN
jgi:hypothetical protein